MIVLSLVLVVAAAVSLLVGLFATESLTLIFVAIGLCVASLALLFVGSRQRRQVPAASTSPVSYGAPPTAGGATISRPATAAADADEDDRDATVVRKATARDAAAKRVAADGPVARVTDDADVDATVTIGGEDEAPAPVEQEAAAAPAPKKVVKKAAKKSTATKSAKKTAAKATAKKSTAKKTTAKKTTAKKTTATKATAKKTTAKKSSAKATAKKSAAKSTAKKAAKKTTGAAARAALDRVSGVGAAKQDALLKTFGSIEAIKAASEDEISKVEGFGPALAKRVKNELS